MADVRDSKRLRQLSKTLLETCHEHGVNLQADQATSLLVSEVRRLARGLHISERQALRRCLDEETVAIIARAMVRTVEENRRIADATPPQTLSVRDATYACAALAVVVHLATRHTDDADATPLINKASEAIFVISDAVATAVGDDITLVGRDVVDPRSVLTHALDRIRVETWACPCTADHGNDRCDIQERFADALRRLGSWASPERPPARPEDRSDQRE